MAQDRRKSQSLVNTVMNLRVPQRNICWLPEQLLASQGFCSTELVTFLLYTTTILSVGKVREKKWRIVEHSEPGLDLRLNALKAMTTKTSYGVLYLSAEITRHHHSTRDRHVLKLPVLQPAVVRYKEGYAEILNWSYKIIYYDHTEQWFRTLDNEYGRKECPPDISREDCKENIQTRRRRRTLGNKNKQGDKGHTGWRTKCHTILSSH